MSCPERQAVESLFQRLTVTKEEVEEAVRRFNERFPLLVRWREEFLKKEWK